MSKLKKMVIDGIIDREGGYINDPSDSGGETNYGITVKVARNYGFTGSMKDLPRSLAFEIYAVMYWDVLSLDRIEARSAVIAEELADTAVNMGVSRAGEFLQRCLNAFNNCGEHYDDVTVDGRVGPASLKAYNHFMDKRGGSGSVVLFRALNCLQGAFYVELVERREKDEKYVTGWFLNRVV